MQDQQGDRPELVAFDEPRVRLVDVEAAHRTIAPFTINTNFEQSRTLSEILGAAVWLKFENLQFTGSFKERGALNRINALSQDERQRGVITMSAGNHAQGVAYHTRRLGIPATIIMPAGRLGRTWCWRGRAWKKPQRMRSASALKPISPSCIPMTIPW